MKAEDNGICPHCTRADAVVEREWLSEEARERAGVDLDKVRRFACRACRASWQGVRHIANVQHQRALYE